ncbi:MAG: sigma-70 family RNA polymerase sigma factor [Bacteroidales bacterium]|nr:sigma-70 family RNA polymerase sigma factor [Bacteroidales bacterium]
MEDKRLWKNIKNGDREALNKLHKKYFHQMCLYAHKSTNESGIVEELVSDCFIKIWENRRRINIKVSVKNYIFLMLRNSIVDYFRKKQIFQEPMEKLPEIADESYFDEQKQYALLYQALEKLPQQRRKILELAVFDSQSYNEIAQKLNISKNTVKTQIARAYRFLKETLDPKDFYLFYFFARQKK